VEASGAYRGGKLTAWAVRPPIFPRLIFVSTARSSNSWTPFNRSAMFDETSCRTRDKQTVNHGPPEARAARRRLSLGRCIW
jgi:hypothetical protein